MARASTGDCGWLLSVFSGALDESCAVADRCNPVVRWLVPLSLYENADRGDIGSGEGEAESEDSSTGSVQSVRKYNKKKIPMKVTGLYAGGGASMCFLLDLKESVAPNQCDMYHG